RAHIVVGDTSSRTTRCHRAQVDAELARESPRCRRRRDGTVRRCRRGPSRPGVNWRRGLPGFATPAPLPYAIHVVERDEYRADLHRLPCLDVNLRDATAHRRRTLDLGLLRLDFEERRVLADHLTLAHQDLAHPVP